MLPMYTSYPDIRMQSEVHYIFGIPDCCPWYDAIADAEHGVGDVYIDQLFWKFKLLL